jgi:hypothetical protein
LLSHPGGGNGGSSDGSMNANTFSPTLFTKLIVALDARQADASGKLAIGSGPTHCKAHLKLGCSPARVASFHDCVVSAGGPLVFLPMLGAI